MAFFPSIDDICDINFQELSKGWGKGFFFFVLEDLGKI